MPVTAETDFGALITDLIYSGNLGPPVAVLLLALNLSWRMYQVYRMNYPAAATPGGLIKYATGPLMCVCSTNWAVGALTPCLTRACFPAPKYFSRYCRCRLFNLGEYRRVRRIRRSPSFCPYPWVDLGWWSTKPKMVSLAVARNRNIFFNRQDSRAHITSSLSPDDESELSSLYSANLASRKPCFQGLFGWSDDRAVSCVVVSLHSCIALINDCWKFSLQNEVLHCVAKTRMLSPLLFLNLPDEHCLSSHFVLETDFLVQGQTPKYSLENC